MATTFDVLLLNGPCDNTTKTLTQKQLNSGHTQCKGTLYLRDKTYSTPEFKYVFLASGTTPGGGGSGQTPNAPHALGGWEAIRHAFNRELPTAISESRRARQAALRSLSRIRKVRP